MHMTKHAYIPIKKNPARRIMNENNDDDTNKIIIIIIIILIIIIIIIIQTLEYRDTLERASTSGVGSGSGSSTY